ncbi:hypothetical protein KBB05_05410 [Patescibacteria group bacterium]|nr:hypothetical protein [Patescibacteria group bacterium]
MIESSAWKRFVAKRKELASILVGQVENDLATAEQQVIRLQSALDQAQNELKKTQNKVRTIEKKYL